MTTQTERCYHCDLVGIDTPATTKAVWHNQEGTDSVERPICDECLAAGNEDIGYRKPRTRACVAKDNSQISCETMLGNFAYHVLCIAELKPGEKGKYSPAPSVPWITVERMTTFSEPYKVNGIDVGNTHGAVSAYSQLCAPFLMRDLTDAPLLPHTVSDTKAAERGHRLLDYHNRLRDDLYGTVDQDELFKVV